ncbi:MAG: hypothetical protein Q8R11_02270 [bacterium]|nr:hypothetical protein [bacterium]
MNFTPPEMKVIGGSDYLIPIMSVPFKRLKLVFVRHGQKNKYGFLTQEGIAQSKEFFAKNYLSKLPKNGIEIYFRHVKRAVDTAKILQESSPVPVTVRKKLNYLEEKPYSDETIKRVGINKGKWLESEKPSEFLPPTKVLVFRFEKLINHFLIDTMNNFSEDERVVFCGPHTSNHAIRKKHL